VIVRLKISRTARVVAVTTAIGLLAIAAILVVPGWFRTAPAVVAPQPPAVAARRIKVTLFYVSADGTRLAPVDREVAFEVEPAEQAKRIVEAQIAPPPLDTQSAIPPGTTLRALYLLKNGQAYVDLSREVASGHPGGTLNEILTVYTIVEALTANLPAITSVHLLVDGREVETLAGHVDLRRPLRPSIMWVTHDTR
jgi:spore germination protein GerM